MTPKTLVLALATLAALAPAHAINEKYRQKLERSGCTQITEMQGCDINKTRAENAKAGFVKEEGAAPAAAAPAQSVYAGQWVAKSSSGATVATIRIDAKEHVWVNGKKVPAKRSDGALVFKSGMLHFTIQGDRRLKNEDTWVDRDAGTQGLITPE